jgi:hypothetical protein
MKYQSGYMNIETRGWEKVAEETANVKIFGN